MGGENRKSEAAEPAETASGESGETTASAEEFSHARTGRRPSGDRAGLIAGAAVLAACAALVLYGVLGAGGGGEDDPERHRTPTASVTYEVTGTGTADLTYQARSISGKAAAVHAAHLPWRTTVEVPLGKEPIISIQLGEQGGQAHCSLAVRGRHVQSATASGAYGRATCSGALPVPAGSAASSRAADSDT